MLIFVYVIADWQLTGWQAICDAGLDAGRRRHNIAARYPLSETAAAHQAVEMGNKLGTVIVDCA